MHEHKHPVETLLDQKRIAEHTSQSRAQDSSTHRRAQLAHTPQSAISSQLGSKSRRQQEQQEAQRAAAHSMQCTQQSRHHTTELMSRAEHETTHNTDGTQQQRVARNTAAPIPSETHRPSKKEPRECTTKLKVHGSPKATAQAQQSNTEKQEQGSRREKGLVKIVKSSIYCTND